MTGGFLECQNETRRDKVRTESDLYGLDYVEVDCCDQRSLDVTFLGKAPADIRKENIVITGGERIRDIRVTGIRLNRQQDPRLDDCLSVTVDRAGDFSTYTLRVVELDDQGRSADVPMRGFDPRYAHVEFSFKACCPSDLDCKTEDVCPPEKYEPATIDYLAKDYASLRKLILDRLSVVMPDWRERHVPDIGIALVELLAYAGDYLSYHQDAVATEAYLHTARQRISVRRHARLVDYHIHEGVNARTWVAIEVGEDRTVNVAGLAFITGYNGAPAPGTILAWRDLENVPAGAYVAFEPLVPEGTDEIELVAAHSRMHFYTWGDEQCCLAAGATSATLDAGVDPPSPPADYPTQQPDQGRTKYENEPAPADQQTKDTQTGGGGDDGPKHTLRLKPGDVLIFQEIMGPQTGNPADADPSRRQAVRLTKVTPDVDPLNNRPVVNIEWGIEDALKFPVCISIIGPAPECKLLTRVSVALGNVILVDHGVTVWERLGEVPTYETTVRCNECGAGEVQRTPGRFRPSLRQKPLTYRTQPDFDAPASSALLQEPRSAFPDVCLLSTGVDGGQARGGRWSPVHDVLQSTPEDMHFIVEIDNEGDAHIRFGDGELGASPGAGATFRAVYRIGNGPSGNVGAETISFMILPNPVSGARVVPTNPLPATGGAEGEPVAEVKLLAPHSFRSRIKRAITAEDYATLAERVPGVQRAKATLQWTGSWYEVLIAIDPKGSAEPEDKLLRAVEASLYKYRRVGHDIVVRPARYVPLDIELTVCVRPDYLRAHVKRAIQDALSNRILPDGRPGFFHPDNLTFGQNIHLSKLIEAVQRIAGVESVAIIRCCPPAECEAAIRIERLFEGVDDELAHGVLELGPYEIARMDNNPSRPENGRLIIETRGGR